MQKVILDYSRLNSKVKPHNFSESEEELETEISFEEEENFIPARAGHKTKYMATHTVGFLLANFKYHCFY